MFLPTNFANLYDYIFLYFLLLSKDTPGMNAFLTLTIWIISFCVILPKMAKARKGSIIMLQYCQCIPTNFSNVYVSIFPISFSCPKTLLACLPYLPRQLGSFLFVSSCSRWPRQVKEA